MNDWSGAKPCDVLSLWEEIMHQLLLASQLDLYVACTESTASTSSTVGLKSVDSVDSLIQIDEFNIAVKSLASDTLHDDMNRLELLLIDNAGVATKECKNLRTSDTIGDLRNLSVRQLWNHMRRFSNLHS